MKTELIKRAEKACQFQKEAADQCRDFGPRAKSLEMGYRFTEQIVRELIAEVERQDTRLKFIANLADQVDAGNWGDIPYTADAYRLSKMAQLARLRESNHGKS